MPKARVPLLSILKMFNITLSIFKNNIFFFLYLIINLVIERLTTIHLSQVN